MKVKKAAKKIQKMGQKGDTMLAHINEEEAAILKALGGAGTKHPKTGLLQFYDGSSEYGGGDFSGYEGADFSGSTGGTDFGPGIEAMNGPESVSGKPGETKMAQALSQMNYTGGIGPSSFNWGDAFQGALRGGSFGPLGMIGGGIVGGWGGFQNAADQLGGLFGGGFSGSAPDMSGGIGAGGGTEAPGGTTGGPTGAPVTTPGTTPGLPTTPPNWGNYGPSPFTFKFGKPRDNAGLLGG